MNNINKVRNKLLNGLTTMGSWMQIPSADVAEIMGKSGYDWIAIDLEHGRFSNQFLSSINRAIELGNTLPFARIAQVSQKDIKQALDAGSKGIIYPMIESAKQLEQAIEWSLYPPNGMRGVGYCRANLFGKNFDSYIEDSENIIKVAQIEHIHAVHNLDDILQVKGLDAIIIGPYDLSGSMNLTGQFDHPKFIETVNLILQKTKLHDIPMGIHLVKPNKDELKIKIKEGYQFIAYSIDAVFLYEHSIKPKI